MSRQRRVAVAATGTALLGLLGAASSPPAPASAAGKYPPIKHVFVVMLENEGYNAAFQSNPNPYLPSLAAKGAMLQQYFGVAHESLPNYIALLGGQTPTHETQADCPNYTDLANSTPGQAGWSGQDGGVGCVYQRDRKTIANQLDDLHLTWKGYMEDMGFDPARDSPMTCNPPGTAGRQDTTQSAEAASSSNQGRGDQYAARHNPFMYYHAVVDLPECSTNVVTLQDESHGLAHDLKSVSTTPNFSLITPNLCNDGHDPSSTGTSSQCAAPDVAGDSKGGLKGVDDWLSAYVPRILASPAYQQDGMLVIAFDEAANTDNTSCCGEYSGPNTQSPGIQPDPNGGVSGGGQVGAVVLSRYVKPGTITQKPYNHYALLRTLEDMFGCTGGDDRAGHLGAAADYSAAQRPGPSPFGADVFTNPSGVVASSTTLPPITTGPGVGGNPAAGTPDATGGGGSAAAYPAYPTTGATDAQATPAAAPVAQGGAVLRAPFQITGAAQPEGGFPTGTVLLIILLPLLAAGGASFVLGAGRS